VTERRRRIQTVAPPLLTGKSMKGKVFSIEEFAVYDGPGIRTAVFFKGCPLSCDWCHNPEGKNPSCEAVRNPNGCLHCGRCAAICPHQRAYCTACGACLNVCPKGLIRMSGRDYSSKELAVILLKNEAILNMCGGGITFTGGEPLYQADFLLELAPLLKNQVHLAIETSGYCEKRKFAEVIQKLDLVMFDMKIMDPESARYHEGIDNGIILENLEILKKSNIPFIIRVPLIPGVVDTEENIEQIIRRIQGASNLVRVELEPYNKLAGAKYALLGKKYEPRFDDKAECRLPLEQFMKKGIEVKAL
jgi:pyruvate formate lyase activating enzyme